jgi:hypothetical protein
MSQVVFGELLTLLLNCSAEMFINRILELQSMTKAWSSCDLECRDISTKSDLEHTSLRDVKISVKPECIADSVQPEIAIRSVSRYISSDAVYYSKKSCFRNTSKRGCCIIIINQFCTVYLFVLLE